MAARVLERLVDLLPITKRAVSLPLPSYSLKQVEKYVGFERNVAGKGDWAIAMYIQACETDDPRAAEALIGEIRQYNQEDLDATWAVYRWLQERRREI
jgi:predicted RecB family nuclease